MTNVLVKKILLLVFMLSAMSMASAQSISYGSKFDLSSGVTFDDNFLVGSQMSLPAGMAFSNDGMKMFVAGSGGVHEYDLSSPYRADLATYLESSVISGDESFITGIALSNDGLTMFIVGEGDDEINQYSLNSPFTLTAGITHDGIFDVSGQNTAPLDVQFNPDGTKMFITGRVGADVDQYSLTTPFDVTGTVTHDGSSILLSSLVGQASGMAFNNDGSKLFIVGFSNDEVVQFSMTTPYDVTSGFTADGVTFDVSNEDGLPRGIAFNNTGTRMFIVGDTGNDINQYNLNPGSFKEAAANDGSIGNTLDISIDGETFARAGSQLLNVTDYNISGVPAGLSVAMDVAADGSFATLSLIGNAPNNQDANDVSSLTFTFNNSAFVGGDASAVANASSSSSGIGVDFNDNNPIISYGFAYDLLNGAIQSGNFDVSSQESTPQGVTFSADGMKMYVVGREATEVNQYTLTNSFDISSGVSFDGSPLDISGETTTANDLGFSSDGTTLFIVDQSAREIEQYALTTPWDITGTVTNTGTPFGIVSEESAPSGIAFNPSGTKMFIVGFSGDEVNQYSLSNPFDVSSGVSHDGIYSISSQEGNSSSITFSIDGTKMIITGSSTDDYHVYSLNAPYDITQSITYDGSLIGPSGTPTGLAFNDSGSRFFMIDDNSDAVYQYTLNTGSFFESGANDGSVVSSFTITIVDDKFSNSGGSLINGFDYSIFGLPTGLTPNMSVSADGLSVTFSFSGNANNHQNTNDLDEILMTFNNSAFVGGNASVVTNASSASTNWGIDFRDNNAEIIYGNAYDLSASIDSNVGSATGTGFTQGFDFSADGTKLYIIGSTNDNIIQYTLANPYDLTGTPTANGSPVSVAAQETTPTGIAFSNDGFKMIISGSDADMIQQYTLSSAFDITSGITPDGTSISFNVNPNGICYSADGSKLFVITSNSVYQYDLPTPYDISDAVVSGATFNFSSETTSGQGLTFSKNGSKMFISGSGGSYQYSLDIPFEISTGVTFEVVSVSGNTSYDIKFSENAKSYFTLNSSGAFQQNLIQNGFSENAENIGSVDGSLRISLLDGIFNNAGASLTYNTDYTITSLPVGLIPNLNVDANGFDATLTFSGNATNHQYVNSLSDLQFTFNNSAFSSGDATSVVNASSANSDASLTFLDNVPRLVVGDAFNLSNIESGFSSFTVNSQETVPTGFAFNNDGTKVYVIGTVNQNVNEYELSTPYSINTASFSGNTFSLAAQETIPTGIVFNTDGSKMFVCGYGTDRKVNQYSLSTPFDITTATHDGTHLNDFGSNGSITGLSFSRNGDKMFVIGNSSQGVRQYSLETPYEITSGVIFDGAVSITEESGENGLAFNWDGSKLYVVGATTDGVYQYSLTSPFDITAGITYDNVFFDIPALSVPQDVVFDASGTRIYLIGSTFDRIQQHTLSAGSFTETAANQGAVDGSITIQLVDDQFSNSGSTLELDTDFTINGLPDGLVPAINVAGDGTSATLNLTGGATENQSSDNVGSFELAFENTAFVNSNAVDVINAIGINTRVGVDFSNNKRLSYGNDFNLTEGASFQFTYGVSSRQPNPTGMVFGSDGLNMFTVGSGPAEINRFTISEPYNVVSQVQANGTFNLSAYESSPTGIEFSADGSSMFVVGSTGIINEFSLTTPFVIHTGVSHVGTVPGVTNAQDMRFSSNGKKLYLLSSSSDVVFQYNLSAAYDVSSLGTSVASFSVTSQEGFPQGLAFSNDGSSMYVTGSTGMVHQYFLSNPFDLSTGVSYVTAFNSEEVSTGSSLAFDADGSQLFVLDRFGQQDINVYRITSDRFIEGASNEGAVDGFLKVKIAGDSFINTGSTLSHTTDYTVTNLPSGLTPVMTVDSNGGSATLTFSGTATNNQDADDLAEVDITFNNSAFVSGDASDIEGISDASGVGIDFRDSKPEVFYGNGFNIADASYSSKAVDILAIDNQATSIRFNDDGTKLFILGRQTNSVHQYSLSSPYVIDQDMTSDGVPYDISGVLSDIYKLSFNDDGTKMYVVSNSTDDVHQFSLTTPFDITGTVTNDGSFAISEDGFPISVTFNQDGSRMFVIGTFGDKILQYSLSTPYDVLSTVAFEGDYSVRNEEQSPSRIHFAAGGTRMLIIGSLGDEVNQYNLAVPYDITFGVTFDTNFSMSSEDFGPTDFVFNPDGTVMHMLGLGYDKIYEYSIDKGGFYESSENDGTVSGSMEIYLVDEAFTSAGSILSTGAYSLSNLPAGLNPDLSVAVDGRSATLTLSGEATNNQDIHDVAGIVITFNNSAFVGGNAASLANISAFDTEIGIDFRDNNPTLFYGDPLNMANATYLATPYDVSAQDTYPTGLTFNTDGTRMYIAGGTNSRVFEYSLSIGFDLSSTVAYTGNSFDTSGETGSPEDLYLSEDGTRLYVLESSLYNVVQYNIATPFDLSTAFYSGNSFNVEGQDTSPYGLTFSSDGTKMLIGGSDNSFIYQYDLSTAFDLSTVSFNGASLSVDNLESGPTGVVFSADGRYLLVVGDSDVRAIRFTLNTPFDISSGATHDGTLFDLIDDGPTGVGISPDGSQIFVTTSNIGVIESYEINIGGFNEAAANDGSVEGSLNISIMDESFTNEGGTFTHGVDYMINNLPSGLTPSLSVDAEGYSATLTLAGSASLHGDAEDIAGLEFTFSNSAFGNGDATAVANTTSHDSEIGIDFSPYTENDITAFTFTEIDGSATIDAGLRTVIAAAVAGTDISAIIPTISVSQNAMISPDSGVEQDFSSAVTYTVTAENGTQQDWDVTITEALVDPTDILLSANAIDENSSAGSVVGTFSTVDASFDETFTYDLVSGDGDDDNSAFQFSGGAELLTESSFDFETKNSYNIRVQTNDGNGGLFEKTFVITVNDVNEAPTDISLGNATIDESNPAGTLVGMLGVTDEDLTDNHTYSLKNGVIDNASFDITGDELVTAVELDFETKDAYTIEVIVTDQGGLTFEKSFAITVNDLPAQITSVVLDNDAIDENQPSNTLIGSLSTFGEDLTGNFNYDLVSGTGDVDNGSFSITGDQLFASASFDFETKNSYSIRVSTDDGNLSEAFVIAIQVNDVSEAPTDIQLSANLITENNSINDVIGSLTSTDEDAGETFTYDLVAGAGATDNASFDVVGSELLAVEVFDFETQSSYSVRIETNDGNGGTFQKAFIISIDDENETILVVNPITDQNLDEGFATLDIDLSTVFNDQDGDALIYDISSSNTDVVTVSEAAGTLTITEVGAFGSSIVTVIADDGSGITTSDEFTVTVNNVNDAPAVANATADQTFDEGFASADIDLSTTFSDEDGDTVTPTAVSSDENVVTVSVTGNTLTIAEVGNGTSTITLTGSDGNGASVTDEFTVTVN
ncbi:MAG: cadherin domain-containing protein, partial [Ekhidna sp.]